MKKRIFKSFIFVFAVSALITLFVFSGSAKSVKKNGFTFDVQENGVTVVSYTGKAKKVTVPKKVEGIPVTKIGNECFWQIRTMKTLSLPSSVTEIGESAFNECTGLKKVVLPKELKSLGSAAFWYCTNLETVVFDSKAEKVGKDAFRGCDKVTVYAVSKTGAEKYLKSVKTVKYGLTYPTEITVRKVLRINSGKTRTLKVTVKPENTYYSAVSVSTTNKAIADASPQGIVSAFNCGTAVLTYSIKGNEKVAAKCKVTVNPAKVTDLKQTKCTVSGATIAWKKAAGATEYKLTRFDAAKKKWIDIASTDKTVFTVTGLKKSEEVKVRVRSIFKSGKTEIPGGIASITVSARNNSPVKSLKQTQAFVDSITVSWKAVPGAEKYRVILQKANGEQISRTETIRTDCTFEELSPSASFKIKVRAVFKNGEKSYVGKVSEISAKTVSPEKVSALKAGSVTDSGFTLTWSKVSLASKYYIYIYDDAKKAFSLAGKTDKTSFTLSALEPESEVKVKVCAVYLKASGGELIAAGTETTAKTASRPIPKTSEEALSVFIKAFNKTSEEKNFSLFETRKIENGNVLPSEDKYRKLLSSVEPNSVNNYNFISGTETSRKLPLSSVVPTMNGKLSLSQEDIKKCSVSYRGDGNGFFIEITLPAAEKENVLLSSFSKLPDWDSISKSQGVSFSTVAYDKAVITAKVNDGKLDTFSVSSAFTAAGTDGKTAFTIGGTLLRDYIFLWN